MENSRQDADFLYGASAIAEFLGVRVRQAYHLIETKGLPAFRMGKKLCARRSTISAWLDGQRTAPCDK